MKQMSALKLLKISHGPLEYIYGDFTASFEKLSLVDFSYNMLSRIPDSFGMNSKFTEVILSNNNLKSVPDSLWGNPFLVLALDSNNISEIPSSVQNAKTLQAFS